MSLMDRLPTVISCCFCCFLRAGTVMIALFSFVIGVTFAPNVSHTRGFWNMGPILSNYSAVEETSQLILGALSIGLCCFSFVLLVGAICNVPLFIEIYQWGAVMYSIMLFILLFTLSTFCFFLQSDCLYAGLTILAILVCDVFVTTYFLIVTNSLRVSLKFLADSRMSMSVG